MTNVTANHKQEKTRKTLLIKMMTLYSFKQPLRELHWKIDRLFIDLHTSWSVILILNHF